MADYNKIAKLEKAIEEKYGREAIEDPKHSWDEEKEKEYLESLSKLRAQEEEVQTNIIEIDGFLNNENLFIGDSGRICPICESYSFEVKDDIYMSKFECCQRCYFLHVEGREEFWAERKKRIIDENNKKQTSKHY